MNKRNFKFKHFAYFTFFKKSFFCNEILQFYSNRLNTIRNAYYSENETVWTLRKSKFCKNSVILYFRKNLVFVRYFSERKFPNWGYAQQSLNFPRRTTWAFLTYLHKSSIFSGNTSEVRAKSMLDCSIMSKVLTVLVCFADLWSAEGSFSLI